MALDFSLVDSDGTVLDNVRIEIHVHGELFYTMNRNKFPLLERLRDYYQDADYSTDELPKVENELTFMLEGVCDCDERSLLHSMITLTKKGRDLGLQIEVVAD